MRFNLLDFIIRLSLRYRLLVILISLLTLVYGSYLATQLSVDVFPNLDRPRVVIITEAPGFATEEVETLITQPLEIALMGASGVTSVRSQTTAGLNVLYADFAWSTDIRTARQTISERLMTLSAVLPAGIEPQMTPPSSIMGQIVVAGIYRQQGPRGGLLSAIDQTKFVAELSEFSDRAAIHIYQVQDRRDVSSWKEIDFDVVNSPAYDQNSATYKASVRLANQVYSLTFEDPSIKRFELRTISDWVIRPRLLKVTGVAEVFLQGGDRKQYQVLLNPDAMLQYGVNLQDIERTLQASNLNTAGGFALTGETEKAIRIFGRLGSDHQSIVSDLRRVPVSLSNKRNVLLEQVATIQEGPEVKRGDASINGLSGVVFTIVKQPHADTRKLTDDIANALAEIETSLPVDMVINTELFRLKNFIDRGVFNVAEALAIGAFLVVVVLFMFLLNFRTTFITLTAIPISLVLTTLVFRIISWMSGTDLSINVMTLGGMAVAMGELVDDAIVDVENIFRRLRENSQRERPLSSLQVVYSASTEIRSSLLFGTIVVILVFLPLFALSGVEGRLFTPLGAAYVVSILSSFVVSLTLTPVLSYYLLPSSRAVQRSRDGVVLQLAKKLATPLIKLSMLMPGTLLILSWLVFATAVWQVINLGRNFLPAFDEGSIQVNVTLPSGSSLDASNQVSATIDRVFMSMQKSHTNPKGAILHFVRRTGRAQMDEHASPVNFGEYILSMNPDNELSRDEMIANLLARLKSEAPGVDVEVEQPLAHLISHMVSGVYAQIAIKVVGDDLDALVTLANETKSVIETVPGITTPIIEPIQMTPELHIILRGEDLAFYGLTRQYVAKLLETALQGRIVGEVLEGQRRFDLVVRLRENIRTDYANLQKLKIDLPYDPESGGPRQIELKEIANVGEGIGPNSINRENGRRRVVVRCNTQGRDLASAVQEIQQRLSSQLTMPMGYYLEYDGQFITQQNSTRVILLLACVSVFGMMGVLLILFPSIKTVLQILNALPTAFIGGAFALVVTQQTLTVASLVGFISLGGIAVRNGILLVTHYLHLMRVEGEPFSPQMILRGSLERLAPVLMTALTAGIGLIPLVVGGEEPGREILYPVATVILGGLITSTFCEFLIHPGLFLRFSGQDANRLADDEPRTLKEGL